MQYLKYAIIPIILGVILISCEKDDNSIIDPLLKFPRIDSASFTPTTYDSDTINGIAVAKVSSEDPVKQVSVTLFNPDGVGEDAFVLKDDGVSPDATAGDGIYSGRVIHPRDCRLIGEWKGEFIAETEAGLFSNNYNNTFFVINSGNLPPVLSSIIITPDSLHFGDTTFFVFQVTVIDPNKACDVAKVFYLGTDPNGGSLTSRNLYDDGGCCPLENTGLPSGDTTANDNKFVRKFYGSPTLQGYYRYFIRAIDRTGDTSNVLADSIYIYP